MRRRTFVAGMAAVMAARGAEAQQGPRTHRVGLLTLNPRSSGSAAAVLDSLRQGFKEMGYREGENLVLEPRFAEGNRDLLQLSCRSC
jgi:putative tryptophan/tyrosine transport system substrate-binding protein